MRLINTATLHLEEFFDASIPKYAILSHRWGTEEIRFCDMADLNEARSKAGFAKVQGASALAASQGYAYVWIDTCCIDKSSSAELSEAINSMYRWYKRSAVCYAYLVDVDVDVVVDVDDASGQFASSTWFSRGWTLQELIAPNRVEFYTSSWVYIGEKKDAALLPALSRASLVDRSVLAGVVDPLQVSVARRMFWASSRHTTRKEDEAYCLMGLFDVNMPLLYGEGEKAFRRLQQEITKTTPDQSIFAWYCHWEPQSSDSPSAKYVESCWAPSPRSFAMSGDISLVSQLPPNGMGWQIGAGVVTEIPVVLDILNRNGVYEVILQCQVGSIPGIFPTLQLGKYPTVPGHHYNRYFHHGVMTRFSLRHHESLFADSGTGLDRARLGFRLGEAIGEPADGVRQVLYSGGDANRQFVMQRVTIRRTIVLGSGDPTIGIPTRRGTNAPFLDEAAPGIFWLVPLAEATSETVVSIDDVYPADRWDPFTNQFMWPHESNTLFKLPVGSSETAGAARVRLTRRTTTESLGQAVVVFGMTRARGQLVPSGWCTLVDYDGASGIERYAAADAVPPHVSSLSVRAVGSGVELNASVSEIHISRWSYQQIRLWPRHTVVAGETGKLEPPQAAQPSGENGKKAGRLWARWRQ